MKARRFACTGVLCAVAALLLWPSAASGHGETATTDPENGATLKAAPKTVSVSLTEPPAQGAEFVVDDGCGRSVSRAANVDGEVLTASISQGEPGKWSARYRVVSAVDGHLTKDTFAFTVRGRKDCSTDEPKSGNNEDPGQNEAAPTTPPEDDGGSFPVVPVAAGTAALVALAFVIRMRSAQ